jgi:hypothetical protein
MKCDGAWSFDGVDAIQVQARCEPAEGEKD